MSDYDVINQGFPAQRHWIGPRLHSFQGSSPTIVTGTPSSFQLIIDAILDVAAQPTHPAISDVKGVRHTSDSDILRARPDLIADANHPALLTRDTALHNVLTHLARKDVIGYSDADMSASKAAIARTLLSPPA